LHFLNIPFSGVNHLHPISCHHLERTLGNGVRGGYWSNSAAKTSPHSNARETHSPGDRRMDARSGSKNYRKNQHWWCSWGRWRVQRLR